MANPTVGFGLRYVRRIDSAAPTMQLETRQIAYNLSDVLYTGDLVKPLNTGLIALFDAADTRSVGVFHGCEYVDPNTAKKEWYPRWNAPTLASGTLVTAKVCVDPNAVWAMRNSSASTPITEADVGLNADISYVVGDGRGQSKSLLDQSTLDTTATLPLRVVGLLDAPDNDNTLGNNTVLVRLNTSELQSATGL